MEAQRSVASVRLSSLGGPARGLTCCPEAGLKKPGPWRSPRRRRDLPRSEARRPGCKEAPAQEPRPGDCPEQGVCRHHQVQPTQAASGRVLASSGALSQEALSRSKDNTSKERQPGGGRGGHFSQPAEARL